VTEKLVAQALAVARALDEARDVHELHRGRRDLLRLDQGHQFIQSRVGHRGDADVRIDGCEGVGCGGRARLRQGVEEGGLARVGQSDDADLQAHGNLL